MLLLAAYRPFSCKCQENADQHYDHTENQGCPVRFADSDVKSENTKRFGVVRCLNPENNRADNSECK